VKYSGERLEETTRAFDVFSATVHASWEGMSMASPSTPGVPRFLPSTVFARLALEAAQRPERPRAEGTAWVTSLPAADFADMAGWFGPGRERLEATPEGLPGTEEDIVRQAQQAIGTRVERLLSNFAFEAAARKEKTFAVTDGERFTSAVHEGLLKSLPIARSEAGPMLVRLAQELREAARNRTLGGDWGFLREGPEGLVLEIAAPLERLPADRPRARVVGGIAKGR
jgi:hypothetical protein